MPVATFRYFAYGSNLAVPRMLGRCRSARLVGTATLRGWRTAWDKPGRDGTAKLNIRPDPRGAVTGAVYEIDERERPALEAAEPGYEAIETDVGLTYAWRGPPASTLPADWYIDIVEAGARSHGLTPPARPTASDRSTASPA